jgi:predicted metal-dependent HD superfamily phosphohydrolase
MNTSLSVWLEVTEQWGADRADRVAVYRHLLTAYSAKSRHYHDLTHIEHMFEVANDVVDQIQDHDAMYLAIWFHDAEQKLGRDNEALSAELAKKQLSRLGVNKDVCELVASLILSTAHRQEGTLSKDASLLVDIDLGILGSHRINYQQYSDLCRKEYKIPDQIYYSGRRKILKAFLSRKVIFNTPYFIERYESQARTNIQWELSL